MFRGNFFITIILILSLICVVLVESRRQKKDVHHMIIFKENKSRSAKNHHHNKHKNHSRTKKRPKKQEYHSSEESYEEEEESVESEEHNKSKNKKRSKQRSKHNSVEENNLNYPLDDILPSYSIPEAKWKPVSSQEVFRNTQNSFFPNDFKFSPHHHQSIPMEITTPFSSFPPSNSYFNNNYEISTLYPPLMNQNYPTENYRPYDYSVLEKKPTFTTNNNNNNNDIISSSPSVTPFSIIVENSENTMFPNDILKTGESQVNLSTIANNNNNNNNNVKQKGKKRGRGFSRFKLKRRQLVRMM